MGQASESRVLLPALAALPGYLLWRAQARVQASLGVVLPRGVDLHAYAVLVALGHREPCSQQELAGRLSVSRTTMVTVAADLVARGLVQRVRNPADRRSYALTRTVAGAAAAHEWPRIFEQVERTVAPGLTPEECRQLRALLLRVVGPDLAPEVLGELLGSVGFLVTRTHALAYREVSVALQPLDIEPRHLGSLSALLALGPVSQRELADALGVTPAGTVQIVDELERHGLVERRRLTSDRRRQVLHLTPEAPARTAEVSRRADAVMTRLLGDLCDTERQRLVVLLQRIVTAEGRA